MSTGAARRRPKAADADAVALPVIALSELAPIAMIVADGAGVVTWANARGRSLTQLGARWDLWLRPDDLLRLPLSPDAPVSLRVTLPGGGGDQHEGMLTVIPVPDGIGVTVTPLDSAAIMPAVTQAPPAPPPRAESRAGSARQLVVPPTTYALQEALDDNSLQLHYQPLVDLATGTVAGAEALIRWHRPSYGPVAPLDLVAVAEDAGLAARLDSWVLEAAARQVAKWLQDETLPAGLAMHLNLSAHQLRGTYLADHAAELLGALEVPPHTLCVEIDEDALVGGGQRVWESLAALRSIGMRVALSDVGTGDMSLAQLHRTPVDLLKLDAKLVAGLPGGSAEAAIAETVQAVADALSLETVAVGVERREQATMLRDIGFMQAQGHHYGQAVTSTAFSSMARRPALQGLR